MANGARVFIPEVRRLDRANTVMVEVFRGEAANLLSLGHVRLTTFSGGEDNAGYYVDFRPAAGAAGIVWAKEKRGGEYDIPDTRIFLHGLNVDVVNGIWQVLRPRLTWGAINRSVSSVTGIAGERPIKLNSASLCGTLLMLGGLSQIYGRQCGITLSRDIVEFTLITAEIAALLTLASPGLNLSSTVLRIRDILVSATTLPRAVQEIIRAFNAIPVEEVAHEQLVEFGENLIDGIGAYLTDKLLGLASPFVTTPEAIESVIIEAHKQQQTERFEIIGELPEQVREVGEIIPDAGGWGCVIQ